MFLRVQDVKREPRAVARMGGVDVRLRHLLASQSQSPASRRRGAATIILSAHTGRE
jgi:hypothetical protein